MKLKKYRVTLKHDGGTVRITTFADSADAAIEIVTKAENAPKRAVINVETLFPAPPTIAKIITKVNCKYGAPMGRSNVGAEPKGKRIFDQKIPLTEGYDKGGAYWGMGQQLRVRYTKDLSFIEFYRK